MSQRAPAPELNVPHISLQDWKAAAPSATVVFQHDLLREALNRGLSVLPRRKGRVEKTKGLHKSKGDHNTADCVFFWFVCVFGLQHCSQEAFNQSCTECKLSAWLPKEGYCPCALYFFLSIRKLQNNAGLCGEQVISWKLRGAIGRSAQRGLGHVVFWLKMTNLGSDGQFQLPSSWLTLLWWIEILGPA